LIHAVAIEISDTCVSVHHRLDRAQVVLARLLFGKDSHAMPFLARLRALEADARQPERLAPAFLDRERICSQAVGV
jgi:hypothetical protein